MVQDIRAMPCAEAAKVLGAGRTRAGEAIDLAVGLHLTVAPGDTVTQGKTFKLVKYPIYLALSL